MGKNTGRSSKPKRSPLSQKKVTVKVLSAGMKTSQKKTKSGSTSRYFKALLLITDNNTKMDLFSYGDWASRNYGLLKEGLTYEVSGKMYESSKTKYNRNSVTKSDKIWEFEEINVLQSTTVAANTEANNVVLDDDVISVATVKEFVARKRNSGLCKMEGVHIVKAKVYRYMGCGTCQKSLCTPTKRGHFSCPKCKTTKIKPNERVMYMMLRDVVLQDGSGMVDNVVCFNDHCEKLLNKKASEFLCDEEARALLEDWKNSTVDLDIQVIKSKHRRYAPTTTISSITLKTAADVSRTRKKYLDEGMIIYRDSKDQTPDIISDLVEKCKTLDLDSIRITVNRTITGPRVKKDYELDSKPSGHLLIINNEFQESEDPEHVRVGTEKDAAYLTELFEALDFKVFQKSAYSDKSLRAILKDFKGRLVKDSISSCAVIILSHGSINKIELENGTCVNVWTDVIAPFNDQNFPEFSGLPKIFLFNTCQVFLGQDDTAAHDTATNLNDTMIIYAATPGQYAHRQKSTGSHFIRYFIKVVMDHGANWDLHEMVEETQELMAKNELIAKLKDPEGNPRQEKIQQLCFSSSFYFQRFQFKLSPIGA